MAHGKPDLPGDLLSAKNLGISPPRDVLSDTAAASPSSIIDFRNTRYSF
ncbi:unnamed protein product [Rhodiola kirilowii]